MIVVRCMSDVEARKPQYWYLQRYEDQEPFWDSYMHTGCVLLRKQDYKQSPFKSSDMRPTLNSREHKVVVERVLNGESPTVVSHELGVTRSTVLAKVMNYCRKNNRTALRALPDIRLDTLRKAKDKFVR